MKKITILALVIVFSFSIHGFSQNSNLGFGVKAGANYSKFTPDFRIGARDFVQYQRKFGFYAGGFLNVGVSDNLHFQPELLFAVQGTGILIEDIRITDTNGEVTVSDFESNVNELTIVVPLVFRYYFNGKLFLDGGPQMGYIVDRNEKIKKTPLEEFGDSNPPMEFDFDKFDLGLTIGSGYVFSPNLTLNGRFFFGLIERDNSVKSSVFSIGIEYNL